ncbi:leucine-rich repeat-containing protein 74A-like [Ruditapes philippinarum]|uniref:leucine-rich repeat-containing protein 74A-like n=1 Tax=Ruditapes philippinarum TaxID=129788 RepID=UPI00295B79DF|nr:leucine-rich repeat-containing protein 74A-like [Ruditapes philippinarum]
MDVKSANKSPEIRKQPKQTNQKTFSKERHTNHTRVKNNKKASKERTPCVTGQPSFIRSGSTQTSPISVDAVPISSTPTENINPDIKPATTDECTSRKPPTKCIQREFTFTGYDIMSDVEPKKVIKETALQKRDRENVQQYIAACKQLGVVPSSYVSRHINDKNLVIKSQPLGQKGARALCVSLVHNHIVEKLDLEENDIGSEGAISVAEMLEENVNISEVRLAGNLIGPRGIEALSNLLKGGRKLYSLDVSGSGIDDNNAKVLADLIEVSIVFITFER